MERIIDIRIKTEYIKLQQLIKLANVVSQGSDAKMHILSGNVYLDEKQVFERGKKVYPKSQVKTTYFGDDYIINVLKDQ